MELKIDTDKFDECQAIFVGEIIEKINVKLEYVELEGETLKEFIGNIAFSIACAIDNASGVEFEGVEVNPF